MRELQYGGWRLVEMERCSHLAALARPPRYSSSNFTRPLTGLRRCSGLAAVCSHLARSWSRMASLRSEVDALIRLFSFISHRLYRCHSIHGSWQCNAMLPSYRSLRTSKPYDGCCAKRWPSSHWTAARDSHPSRPRIRPSPLFSPSKPYPQSVIRTTL